MIEDILRPAFKQGRDDALAAAARGAPFPPHTDEYRQYVWGYMEGAYKRDASALRVALSKSTPRG